MRRWTATIAAALLVAGCGGSDGGSGAARGDQGDLDDVTGKVTRMFAVLEEAYPEDEGSTAAIVDSFSEALVDEDVVESVRTLEDWTPEEELPCGEGAKPDLGVIATGPDETFFVGVASRSFVAGFAEDDEGDVGVVVARCSGGAADRLLAADLPEGDRPLRVAVESFEADGPVATATTKLYEAYEREEPPVPAERQQEWQLGQPIDCPDGEEPQPVGTGVGSDHFTGYGSEAFVVVYVEHLGDDIGAYAAPCEDGAATDLRRLARPLADALEDR